MPVARIHAQRQGASCTAISNVNFALAREHVLFIDKVTQQPAAPFLIGMQTHITHRALRACVADCRVVAWL